MPAQSCGWRTAEIDAGEVNVLAFAAGLKRLDLVQGLDELAVEVPLMLRYSFEVRIRRQDAKLSLLLEDLRPGIDDVLLSDVGRQVGADLIKRTCEKRIGGAANRVHGDGDLVAEDAVETPKEACDALSEAFLKAADGFDTGDDAIAVAFPVGLVFHAGDDGAVGGDAVEEGVVALLGHAGLVAEVAARLALAPFRCAKGRRDWLGRGSLIWRKRVFIVYAHEWLPPARSGIPFITVHVLIQFI